MIFKTKANVIMNEHQINQVNYTKFLGLYIDEELIWKYHINHVNESGKNDRHNGQSKTFLTS